jgi:pimeloyl-ACP methyl ester carboxylesterase
MTTSKLVLLHPWGNDVSAFAVDPDLASFLAWRQAELFPLPTDAANAPTSIAESIVHTIKGEIDLVGIADSCAVALSALVQYPERVRSAMLVNPSDDAALLEDGSITPVALERWFTPFARRHRQLPVRYVEALASRQPEMFAAGAVLPLVTSLSGVRQPVSVVVGTAGTSPATALAIHAALPLSRMELVPGRVFTHLEFPHAFMSAIYHHLTWTAAPQRIERPLLFSPLGSMGEWNEVRVS